MYSSRTTRTYRYRQRGAAFIVMLVFMIIGVAAFLVSSLSSSALKNARDAKTTLALAQTKDALIGWSVSRGDIAGNPRPGELPCPDTSAPGTPSYGTQSGACVAGAIGRIPWKTLGIEEPRDGYGETLWYAIDGSFRIRGSNNNPINSDTRPSMLVYDKDGTTLLTPVGSEAVAIIFSPGPAINGQQRGTPAAQISSGNYLDSVGPPTVAVARNNASIGGPFIQGNLQNNDGSTAINDGLLIVTTKDLMPIIEKRVASEVRTMLANYFSTNNYYPYPANYNDPNCLDVGPTGNSTNCQSDSTMCVGRLPDTASTASPTTPDWSSVSNWFYYNLWGQVIYYAVGTNYLKSIPANCSTTLTLNGTPGTHGLFVMPGTPLGAIVRNSPSQSTTLNMYLEDATNQNGWTTIPPLSDHYITPTATSNDRMQLLP